MKTTSFGAILATLAAAVFAETACAESFADPSGATGYVRVKQIDGVWWFIGPDGQRFISLGVNHVEPHLWLAPYNREATLKRYGQDMIADQGLFNPHGAAVKRWIDRQIEICGDLHFNTFGKQRWIEHLRQRYGAAEDAAKVWGLPISPAYGISWDKMARLQTWFEPIDADRVKQDMIAFMYAIAEQWYRMHHELLRKYDPHHLILGDKNMVMWHYEWMIPAMKKYVDVVTIQAYGRWEQDGKTADRLYEQLGKPIYNGDGSFSYVQPNQKEFGAKGWRTGARSFEEVAALYQETLEGMMAKPYIVGWRH